MEYLFIYGLQMADMILGTGGICAGLMLFCAIALVPLFVYKNDDSMIAEGYKIVKTTAISSLIIVIICSLLPTKETLLLIGGTYLGKKAVNQVVTSDKLEKVNTIIDLQLDKYIKDLQGATK